MKSSLQLDAYLEWPCHRAVEERYTMSRKANKLFVFAFSVWVFCLVWFFLDGYHFIVAEVETEK